VPSLRLTSAARYNARALKQHAGISSQPSERASLTQQLRGLLLPITTPFAGNGDLDLPGLKANISEWNQTGIAGYVVLGSTGERVNLDEREYLEVIEAARQEVEASKDGLAFIVGAGQQSTRGTINEIKRVAKAVPVDAVLVITPHFYRPSITQETLVEHYQRVADDSPAPLILYSMPALTGIKIEPKTAALLSEHENIIGIKDSSADLEGLKETIKLVRKDFAVLTGNGTVLHEALLAGACGGILAVGCVVPELCIEIIRAVSSGETERAARLQSKLTPLASAVTTRFGIGGLKAALDMKGFVGGAVRAPLRAPDDEARAEIQRCLEEAEYEPPKAEVRSQRSEVRGQHSKSPC
jgi:4-hydroxy-2-oxoglutarate aldolase